MPLTFPCPNPACTQVFSPQDVRGVASLTCPRCGHVFQFGSAAPAAAPAPRPVARPPAPPKPAPAAKAPPPPARPAPPAVPVARAVKTEVPVATAVPLAVPVAAEPEPEVFVPPPEPPKSRRGSKTPAGKTKARRSRRRWLLPVVLGALLVASGVAAWLFRDWWVGRGPVEDDAAEVVSEKLNYRFRYPRGAWKDDFAVVRDLGTSLGMRRSDPNAWFALVVRDYKDRMPRDDELVSEAVNRLRKLSRNAPQWELRDEAVFADLPAQRLVFTAEYNNVPVSGECLMTADKGIGYWFIGWTPSAADPSVHADVQQEWGTIRKGFSLLKARDGWTGKVPEVVEAEGKKAGYRLKYTKGLWEKDSSDESADLLLLGRDPDNPGDGLKWAWVRVFVRPGSGKPEAALKEARAFLEEREKKVYPEVTMDAAQEAAKGGLADGPVQLGQTKAQAVRLRVKRGAGYEHFFAVAAVPRSAYTLVIVGECPWQQREAWEDRFGPVLHSLHFEKK